MKTKLGSIAAFALGTRFLGAACVAVVVTLAACKPQASGSTSSGPAATSTASGATTAAAASARPSSSAGAQASAGVASGPANVCAQLGCPVDGNLCNCTGKTPTSAPHLKWTGAFGLFDKPEIEITNATPFPVGRFVASIYHYDAAGKQISSTRAGKRHDRCRINREDEAGTLDTAHPLDLAPGAKTTTTLGWSQKDVHGIARVEPVLEMWCAGPGDDAVCVRLAEAPEQRPASK